MKRIIKCVVAALLLLITVLLCVLPSGATWYYPDGKSVYDRIISDASKVNRNIYVYHKDRAGNLLKYCEYQTGTSEGYDSFIDSIYGYDLVGFSSSQDLGEECHLSYFSENQEYGASAQIGYEFYKMISSKSLTVNLTYELQDPVLFTTKHYLVAGDGTKSVYSTISAYYSYGNTLNIKKKTLAGYTLDPAYQDAVTGKFTYDILDTCENVWFLNYDYVHGSHQGEMYDRKSYSESSSDYIPYRTNREMDVRFYYNINSYTVNFNANGGSGAPGSISKYYGQTVKLPTKEPTRSGYVFKGWATTSTATAARYQAGGDYPDNVNRTLYAVWEKIAPTTYTVSYNANGGTGAPASQKKTKDVPLTLSSTRPTRSGYTFLGWSTTNGVVQAVSYNPGGTYVNNASVTLYAVWQEDPPIETYTVSYDANGGTGAPASQIKIQDVALTLSSVIPYRNGYTFLGWNTSSTATAPTYYPSGIYTANASAKLYAVWEKNAPEIYTVRYNGNGGTGAPMSQEKTEDIDLILSFDVPTRNGYDFLGWNTSSNATEAEYMPGDIYDDNASVTLYAVWKKSNYEFSISNLTFSEDEVFRNGQISINVRCDSWDQINAYSDIPVEPIYDGQLLSTQYIDFDIYGVSYVTFTLNVGDGKGNKPIEVWINRGDCMNETDSTNNSVSSTLLVKDYVHELSAEPIMPNSNYYEGTEVVSSFYIKNDSDLDVIPSDNNTVQFSAYYYNGTQKVILSIQEWNNAVVPSHGTNLVYFKWQVPEGIAGKTVYCECTVNANFTLDEQNNTNNTVSFSVDVATLLNSQTPDTRFESEAPSYYQNTTIPTENTDKATWTMWEYENGAFVLKYYGVYVSYESPEIAPSDDCLTAFYENGKWTIRSGYGITIEYDPSIVTVSDYLRPKDNAYTAIQYVLATFPEYRYYDTDENCRRLEYVNGSYQFVENTEADGSARVHFIPVFVEDGYYVVTVKTSQVWTPVGMITATRNANFIIIDGTIYDDWYQG